MDDTAEILIERHFGEGYSRRITLHRLQEGLNRGKFVESEKYETGEFGLSLLFTSVAIGLIYFDVVPSLAEPISLWIAAATVTLVFSVASRTKVISLLAYEGPAGNGSLVENTKRFAWNNAFLNLYPLSILVILNVARAGGPKLYRLTVHSFGVSLERTLTEDIHFAKAFIQVFLPAFWEVLTEGELPSDILPASSLRYLNETAD